MPIFDQMNHKLLLAGLLLVLLVSQPAAAVEQVTLQLKWTHAFQFAGYYAAKEKGYYRDAGLQVDIQEAQPDLDVVRTVVSGRAQYGVGTSSLLLARHAGQPVVVLAVIFQHSPLVLVARKEYAAQSIHDLLDKRVMIEPQSDELLAYLRQEGIASDRLVLVPHSFDYHDLLQGKVAAMSAYASNELYYLDKAHFDYQVYTPRSAGIDFYGDNLFTSQQELDHHPERVAAFRSASLRGWQYAMQHPDEIARLIYNRYSQQHPLDFYRFEATQMVPLLRQDLIELGYMHPGRWRHIAEVYADRGLLPHDVSLDGFLFDPSGKAALYRLYLYIGLLAAGVVVVGLVAGYILQINRRLKLVAERNRMATAELVEQEDLWRTIIKTSPDGITITSLEGNIRQISDKLLPMFGYETTEEVLGRNIFEFLDPAYHEKAAARIGLMLNGTYTGAAEYPMIRKDGSRVWVEANAEILRDRDGKPRELFFIERDITERRRIEAKLRSLSVAIEQGPVSVVITAPDETIQYVNPCFTAVTGYSADEVLGLTPRELKSGLTEQAVYAALWRTLGEGRVWSGEFINKRKNGELFWEEAHIAPVFDEADTLVQYIAVKLDITDRKRAEEQIKHLAQYDSLTDLPNRLLFSGMLQQALTLAQRDTNRLALLFVDLDRFKPINDTYGHALGDQLLRQLAQRMKEAIRASDTVGRIGGDEFVVLLPKLDHEADAIVVAEKLRQALQLPCAIDGCNVDISACIGIAIYPEHGTTEKMLFQHADMAMYCAKQKGKNAVEVFDAAMLAHRNQQQDT